MVNSWHAKTAGEVLEFFHSNKRGLSKSEAGKKLLKFGYNKLPEAKTESLFLIFARQFQSPLIYTLAVASFILLAMRDFIDAGVVIFVLIFNAVVGTIQEGRARNIFMALRKLVETQALVLRDEKEILIPDAEVVPGDVIILQEGDKIPADARIISADSLKVDEASFTGESMPVHKIEDVIKEKELAVTERKNMVFRGTHVVGGKGEAVVVATGVKTEIGKITREISKIDTEIPLKADIKKLSKVIIFVVAAVIVTLFFIGIAQDKSATEMFTMAVALAVSVIPEGLPIVMTLVLATGVWRMGKKNVLIKKLQAVEALGQAKIIAVDKTGTVTENKMMVQSVFTGDKFFEVEGSGYDPRGKIRVGGKEVSAEQYPQIGFLGEIAALNSNAQLYYIEKENTWRVSGDPTEAAMLVFSAKLGFNREILEQRHPQIAEIPFDYKKKYRAVLNNMNGKRFLTVSGAPEVILDMSEKVWKGNKEWRISTRDKRKLEKIFMEMSRKGLRVVALATAKNIPGDWDKEKIPPLSFAGFVGIRDTLRDEVERAVEKARSAGIRVVMITGDHLLTAEAIAKEAGIYKKGDKIITGNELDEISEEDLADKINEVKVFARVTPEHKLKIINAYRQRGDIVAMTGDGVNDAPSLVAADLGVAMGRVGTEVAKEAADIVLLDDNFKNISSAISEGRNIFKTIKRVILYLFSTGSGEVLVITGAMLMSFPLPLLPAQIIWLNLITDGFLDVALAMEPKEKGLLKGKFKERAKSLFDKLMAQRMVVMAIPMMIGTLVLFARYFEDDLQKAWSISLTSLAVFQWLNAWNCRSEEKSVFQMNPFSNKFLNIAIVAVILLQIAVLYVPFMQKIFHTVPLTVNEWLAIIAISFSIILAEEIRKFIYRRKEA